MDWIMDRVPRLEELRVISCGMCPAYGEFFLVWDGEMVDIDFFEVPAGSVAGDGRGAGFWRHPGVLAWRPLPSPPIDTTVWEGGRDGLHR